MLSLLSVVAVPPPSFKVKPPKLKNPPPRNSEEDCGESEEEGLGAGLALVESTLAALGATLTLRFERQWSQARIEWSEHDA